MHIGVVLPQGGEDWDEALALARHAEEIGVDSIWVVDHVISGRGSGGILEAWTMMSALAASTERVEIGAQVLCQSFRNPALLAKMAATLDKISGGRLRLLIGTGWMQQEYDQFGWEFPAPGVRVEELKDTVRILKGLLSGTEPFTYEGKHYWVRDAVNTPAPVRNPLPIEIGGGGDRMLRFIAKEADGWNCPGVLLSRYDDRQQCLKDALERNGRPMSDIRLSVQIACAIDDEEAAKQPMLQFFGGDHAFVGSREQVIERASQFAEKGVEGFHLVLPRGPSARASLDKMMEEVKPKVG